MVLFRGARTGAVSASRGVWTGRAGWVWVVLLAGVGMLRAQAPTDVDTANSVVVLDGGEVTDVPLLPGQQAASALPVESGRWENLGQLNSGQAVATAVRQSASGPADEEQDDPAARTSGRDGAAAGGLSTGGIAPMENSQTVDGLSAEQYFRSGPRGSATGGPSSGSSFSEGAVRSFRVLPHSFSAQYGGAGGGLAVLSREGEEALHGAAFVYSRASEWAATNPFSIETHYRDGVVTSGTVKPSGSMEVFGVELGAPLGKAVARGKKVWVFGSLEGQVHDDRIVSSPATAGFYELSAEQLALLENRGVGAAATNGALNYLDSLSGTTERFAYRMQGFGRADAVVTARDRVGVSYAGTRFSSPAGVALGQASDAVVARGRGSLGDSEVQVDAVSARWLRTLSARWSNEVRGQMARDMEFETPRAPLAQEPAIGPGGLAPQVSIEPNGFAYGTPSSLAWSAAGGRRAYPDEARLEVADTMHVRAGRHVLAVGGDWSRIHDRIDALNNAEGAFSYDSGTTNGKDGGLVDWITDYTFNVNAYPNGGCPSIVAAVHDFCFRSFTQSFNSAPTEFVTHTVAGFAEDSLRVGRTISLSLGVRYEYLLLPPPQTANGDLDAGIAALGLAVHGATSSFPEDRNNVGPRVSAAWAPRLGKKAWAQPGGSLFTLRAGYGVFFGRIPGATVRAALTDTALPSTTLRVRIRPTTETLCPQVTAVQQGFGYPCDYTSAPPAAVAQTSSAMVFASTYRIPEVQRATLVLEREVGRRTLVRLSYQGAMATQLPGSTDINIAASPGVASYVLQGGQGHAGLHDGETFVVPVYRQRLLSAYGPVTALVSNSNATYHSGTAEVEMHGAGKEGLKSLEVRGSYMFSRAIDYAPQNSATPAQDGQFDPYRNGYDKGLSNQQFPHRFTGDLIYRTSFAHGPMGLRKALGDWRLAAIGIAGSGAPYSYQIFGGTYLSGGRETINGSGGATYLPTIGRNTLRLPGRSRVDLRIGKDFAVPFSVGGNRARINVFAAAFNLLNTVNLSAVETRAFLLGTPAYAGAPTPLVFQDAAAIASEGLAGTSAFGVPTSSTTGVSRERQIEVGLRLQF